MTDVGQQSEAYFRERYGIDQTIASELLGVAMSRGGDRAELFFEHREGSNISFEQQAVKSASRSITQGVGMRVLQGEAIGYAFTEDLSRDAMRRAADTAARIASPWRQHTAGRRHALRISELLRAIGEHDWRRAGGQGGADPARRRRGTALRPEHRPRRREFHRRAEARDDRDQRRPHRRRRAAIGAVQRLVPLGARGQPPDRTLGRRRPHGHGVLRIAHAGSAGAGGGPAGRLLQSAIDAPAGTFPVVLAAGDSGILLHEAIGHGLEADFNRKKTSNYTDQVGNVVASELCTVVDDGTIRDSRGSINIDDEGNLPGYNVLIEDGVLRGYMQDALSTKHFGVAPTATAAASPSSTTRCRG